MLKTSQPKSTKLLSFLMQLWSFHMHTPLKKVSSNKQRFEVACKDSMCKFSLIATKSKESEGLVIKTAHLEHSCDPSVYALQRRTSIPSLLLVHFTKEYIHSDPKASVKGNFRILF
jgi:hypothetical protein